MEEKDLVAENQEEKSQTVETTEVLEEAADLDLDAESDPLEALDPPILEESLEETPDLAALNDNDSQALPQSSNNGILLKKSHLIIGVAVALALMIGGFFLGYFLRNGNEPPLSDEDAVYSQADPMKPDPNAKPYGDVQAFPESPTPGNIIMPGYSELRMHADTNLLKAIWINSEGNSCYLRFTLRLEETGETLYQSGLIAPGMAVEESFLTRSMERGEYRVEILIEAFTLTETPAPLNSMKVLSVALYVL